MIGREAARSTSVVIPTFQRRERLLRALSALARQDLDDIELEVVVSIDGGDDGTREALAALAPPYGLHVVHGPQRGRAAACNAAIRLARGEVLVILDDDMEPAPTCVRNHVRHHETGSRLCVMGAVPISADRTHPPAARYIARKFNAHLERLAEPGHAFVLRDFYSGNTSIRRDLLLEVGAFDESFTRYGNEDLELSLRLRRAGVELRYDPEALAYQDYRKTLPELARDTVEKGGTAVLLARSHEEAFAELQLARFHEQSRRWMIARAAILAVTRGRPRVAAAFLRAAELLERLGLGRVPLFYLFLLDYLYWSGAAPALAEAGPNDGPLARLAEEVRHGPVRLLLHR
jgi:GT2 family glycosyltransferase